MRLIRASWRPSKLFSLRRRFQTPLTAMISSAYALKLGKSSLLQLNTARPPSYALCSFHDPEQDSVFANSQSVSAYSAWSLNAASKASSGTSTPAIPLAVEGDASCITVQTPEGPRLLPSLVTPRTAQGKRIRSVLGSPTPLNYIADPLFFFQVRHSRVRDLD